ncbi:unnamed protein product [Closterium sp. NIES-54]
MVRFAWSPLQRRQPGRARSAKGRREKGRGGPGGGLRSYCSPLVRFAWYASEAFGKAVATVRGGEAEGGKGKGATAEGEPAVVERDAAIKALREDYDKSYFVTGEMTMWLYEPDCEFADPFVSFNGRDRFKQNVSNLGSFMEEVSLKILDWQESEDGCGAVKDGGNGAKEGGEEDGNEEQGRVGWGKGVGRVGGRVGRGVRAKEDQLQKRSYPR